MSRLRKFSKSKNLSSNMAKNLSGAYLDKIHDNFRARDDISQALEYVRETINQFYLRMEQAEILNEELISVVLNSEKAVKINGELDLMEVSEWLTEDGIESKLFQIEGGYVFVFDNTQDAIYFMLRWGQ